MIYHAQDKKLRVSNKQARIEKTKSHISLHRHMERKQRERGGGGGGGGGVTDQWNCWRREQVDQANGYSALTRIPWENKIMP